MADCCECTVKPPSFPVTCVFIRPAVFMRRQDHHTVSHIIRGFSLRPGWFSIWLEVSRSKWYWSNISKKPVLDLYRSASKISDISTLTQAVKSRLISSISIQQRPNPACRVITALGAKVPTKNFGFEKSTQWRNYPSLKTDGSQEPAYHWIYHCHWCFVKLGPQHLREA